MLNLHLGKIAHVTDDPFEAPGVLKIYENGGVLSEGRRIIGLGEASDLRREHPKAKVFDHGASWLLPGMIDGHVHFPQTFAMAADGSELLHWLKTSIFPAEMRYADPMYAREAAEVFVQRLLANGTTTALVFGSQFPHAMAALFETADEAGLRLISGLTLMDRDAPSELFTPPAMALDESKRFIAYCDQRELLHYAVTPRFALSCSEALMDVCRELVADHDQVFVQTHINENHEEIAAVRACFPDAKDYLDVYEARGLLSERCVLAHSIHSNDRELSHMAANKITACHCPSSNLYLGSGLFPMARHIEAGVPVMMGTDIGAGTHFCLIQELAETYKVQQLQRFRLDAARLLFLGTLGGARGLKLDSETGNFASGKSLDLIVVNPESDVFLNKRLDHARSLEEQLFVLLNQADAGHIEETWVAGKKVHGST